MGSAIQTRFALRANPQSILSSLWERLGEGAPHSDGISDSTCQKRILAGTTRF
jgi:hypothetical protein